LVTDLDNTLWGGVVGEDGIDGIQLGIEYPGAAFQAVQRVMLDLYRRGILLAVCSKNNLSDAMEALEKHPGMLLKPEHFAAMRINWKDKAENLREIAAELNIGIDSLAFLDDNPVERERIRTVFPEVTVIELPEDPMSFSRVLRETPVFERLTLSEEDRERGRYYAQQRQRVELERRVSSLEDFYRSLQQEIEIATVTPGTLTRIAQLTQKTNQFNLTTRRYSEQQLTEMAQSSAWKIYSIRVKDRFGDNGTVGVAITHDVEEVCEIDTFLMSCRVISRTVETALISFLIEQARTRGMIQIRGWFLPTKKNHMAADFYPLHGFQKVSEDNEKTFWSLALSESVTRCPEWIKLASPEERPAL
jgi:FkbH-like protein